MHESESESEVAQLCPTLSDPMDCSLPGSSVHGIFQARVLEWGAIAFSESYFSPGFEIHIVQFYIYVCIYIYTEKAMAPQSSILAGKIPWMEEPGSLKSIGSQRVVQD